MNPLPDLGRPAHYVCPNCTSELVLDRPALQPVLHPCRGLKGLLAPMIPDGTRAKVEAHEPDDYIGTNIVRRDGDGRPKMNVTTTRDDGTDVAVFVPTATVTRSEVEDILGRKLP